MELKKNCVRLSVSHSYQLIELFIHPISYKWNGFLEKRKFHCFFLIAHILYRFFYQLSNNFNLICIIISNMPYGTVTYRHIKLYSLAFYILWAVFNLEINLYIALKWFCGMSRVLRQTVPNMHLKCARYDKIAEFLRKFTYTFEENNVIDSKNR